MKVSEFVEMLNKFDDQDAEVMCVVHFLGEGYYDQGGNIEEAVFDPENHLEYTDFRGNQFVSKSSPYFNKRLLLIGSTRN